MPSIAAPVASPPASSLGEAVASAGSAIAGSAAMKLWAMMLAWLGSMASTAGASPASPSPDWTTGSGSPGWALSFCRPGVAAAGCRVASCGVVDGLGLSVFVSIIENIDGDWLSSAGPWRRPRPSGWNGRTAALDATGGTANLTAGNTFGFAVQAAGHLAELQKSPILQWHGRSEATAVGGPTGTPCWHGGKNCRFQLMTMRSRTGIPIIRNTLEVDDLSGARCPAAPGC